jgi:DNA-directed RNA polymerase subunit RPC12/RpoP
MGKKDFSEVSHTGGVATFAVKKGLDGRVSYQQGYSGSAPRPMTLVAVYAHADGFACGGVQLGGIGQPWNPPPLPNCIGVFMASDTEGRFGHECPRCHKHFRSENIPAKYRLTCPYCGLRAQGFEFLTPPQRAYVKHYVDTLFSAVHNLEAGSECEIEINMDDVADAVPGEPRPDFYYSSTTQQTQFKCAACNCFNDVRGKYAYCASCGWRNNVAVLKTALAEIRRRLNEKQLEPGEAVKQAISQFDAIGRDFVAQLAGRVPTKASRRKRLQRLLFHNLDSVQSLLEPMFGIDLLSGLTDKREFIRMMFHRRHVYEHNGGVATAFYVAESGDPTGEEGVLIRESLENVHTLLGLLERMAESLDADFHEIFPPEPFCIELEKARRARMAASMRQ